MRADVRPGAAASTKLGRSAVEEIRNHGTEAFPDECCGALIDVGGTIVEAFRLPNTTGGPAARRFRIGPEGYRLAESRARERHGSLAGFYHSHPNEPARPSAYDLEHAWPNLTYIIISVNGAVAGDIRAWHLREDRSGFDEGEIQWHTGS
jgi:proteasome lid subunit RPN8/RPN11